ncbi:hypothetical protein [Streptomyces sp. NPDC058874]|uniref:hypothetical protein n=1 Tax=unclassified Streptomyces TaxID=2593676 RepID=UPI0036AE976E
MADRNRHQAPGALAALREARRADRRRAGRSVLYYLTSAGQVLLGAQGAGLDGC